MASGHSIDADECVVDLAIDHPELVEVFQRLGIEGTCGGKSLRAACDYRGLVLSVVLESCEARLRER